MTRNTTTRNRRAGDRRSGEGGPALGMYSRPFIVAAARCRSINSNSRTARQSVLQAPMHLKANGGIFLLDDFGRQRIAPQELIKRWIFPWNARRTT